MKRNIIINNNNKIINNNFNTNKVKSNKYTLLTFIPKNILEQFQRLVNIYFLIISIFTSFSAYKLNMLKSLIIYYIL